MISNNMPRSRTTTSNERLQQLLASARPAEPIKELPEFVREVKMPRLSNYQWSGDGENKQRQGLPLSEIVRDLGEISEGWPKAVGKTLFVPGTNRKPRYLENATELFAWLDTLAYVDWANVASAISQERFFVHLRETVERFESVEEFPHVPAVGGAFYLLRSLTPGNGRYLNEFARFFMPATDHDLTLIKAFIVSFVWGGPPGSRPAWLVTALDHDMAAGRGVGKSKLQSLCADLVGGLISFTPNSDIDKITTRLLSPAARGLRVASLDNLKTLRFSWAELESLITSQVISGRQLYVGEGRRPSTLVWVMTLNGATLSRDMAQRVFIIKIRRAKYDPDWETRVRSYLERNRWSILGDAVLLLQQDAPKVPEGVKYGRWAQFERDVLARLDPSLACFSLIRRRQQEVDDDQDEAAHVAAALRDLLRLHQHDPETCRVFMTTAEISGWLNQQMNLRLSVTRVTPHLRTLAIPQMHRVRRDGRPGWYWFGSMSNDRVRIVPLIPPDTFSC